MERDGRVLQPDPERTQVHARRHDQQEVGEEHGEVAGRERAGDHQVGDVEEDEGTEQDAGDRAREQGEEADPHQAPEGGEAGPAVVVEASALAALAPEALHREDVGEALLGGGRGGGAGLARAFGVLARQAGERQRRQEDQGDEGEAAERQQRMVAVDDGDHARDQQHVERRRDRREQQPIAGLGDARRVVHHAVDRIADALVVEGRHRKGVDALEEPRAVVVVEVLGEADGPAEVEVAEQPAGQAEACVGLVLRARGDVLTSRQVGVHAVGLVGGGADRADQQQQHGLRHHRPEQDRLGRRAGEGPQQRLHEEGIGRHRLPDRIVLDDVIDHDLHGPRQQQEREQAHDREAQLHQEARPERQHVAQRAAEQRGGGDAGDALRLLEVGSHSGPSVPVGAISTSTRRR